VRGGSVASGAVGLRAPAAPFGRFLPVPQQELLIAYHRAGRPLSCRIPVQPWICEFWPLDYLERNNFGYDVTSRAPGYLGFASSLGGEMYAISPSGAIVCLAFVGMSPQDARL
jgi:hypothetical protein